MGVTITANNSKQHFDMGSGGFFNLRKNIAIALDADFGKIYSDIMHCHTQDKQKENDNAAELIINKKNLDKNYSDVLDFLYMSDCSGKINYKTCKKIIDLLEPHIPELKSKSFRYAAYAGHDYEDFIIFLKDCVNHRRNMTWY